MNRKSIKWNNPKALQRAIMDTYTSGEVFQHGSAEELGGLKSAEQIAHELKDTIDNKAVQSGTMAGKYEGNYMSVSKINNINSEIDFIGGWKNQIFEPHGQVLAPILWDQGWAWEAAAGWHTYTRRDGTKRSIFYGPVNLDVADYGGTLSPYAYYPGDHYIDAAIEEIQAKYPYARIHKVQGGLLK